MRRACAAARVQQDLVVVAAGERRSRSAPARRRAPRAPRPKAARGRRRPRGDARGAAQLGEIAGEPVGDVHCRRGMRAAPLRRARCAAAAADSGRSRCSRMRRIEPPALCRRWHRAAASTPSAASPIVPVTTTRSPGFARRAPHHGAVRHGAERRDRDRSGPGVRSVSPPSSGQPKCSASAPSPPRSREPRLVDIRGSASDSRKPSGCAPLAARSERLTRSALRADRVRRIVGKKMHAGDDAVGREHEIAARRRRDHGGIVDQAERARMRRERAKIAARSGGLRPTMSILGGHLR